MRKIIALFVLFGLLGMVFTATLESKMKITVKEVKPVISMQPMNCHPSNNGPFEFMIKLGLSNEYNEDVPVYYSTYDMRTGGWVDRGLLLVVKEGDFENKQVQFDFYYGGKGNGTVETPAIELRYDDPENRGLTVRKEITIRVDHWETTNEIILKKNIAEIEGLVSQIEEKGCNATEIKNKIDEMERLMAICEAPKANILATQVKADAQALLEGCIPPAPEEEQEINIPPPEEEQPPAEEKPPVEQPPEEEEQEPQPQQQPGMCPSAFILTALGVLIARWEY
ncbi:MAG: hypothetical protein ACPL06_02955 [Candidatus Anstonellales archaeon]